MVNYFDVATQKEIIRNLGYKPSASDITEMRAYYETDPDLNYQHLFLLYLDRNENELADKYYSLIKDPQHQLTASMLAYECK